MKRILYAFAVLIMMVSACKKDNSLTPEPAAETPLVTNVQPKNPKPGDVVTINGSAFGTVNSDVKVSIGTKVITITSVSNTEIKFTLPDGVTEGDLSLLVKNVLAKNTDAQGAKISPQPPTAAVPTFTALAPATGKVGDVVTLTGTNFSTVLSENVVRFAGSAAGTQVQATVKTATATTITAEVPASAGTGVLSIQVKTATAVMAAGFGGVFTLMTSSGTGNAGTPGQTTILNNTLTASTHITTDADGNVYVLSPPYNAGIPRLARISIDGSSTKFFTPAEFGYTDADFMGVVGVTADKTGAIYAITSVVSKQEHKIWKIATATASPVLFRTMSGYNFSNSVPEFNLSVTSTGEFFFISHDSPPTVYRIDNTGKVLSYLFASSPNNFEGSKYATPTDLAIDQNDNLYVSVSEAAFKGIYKFTPAKVKSVVYSSTVNANAPGTLASATFKAISSISLNADATAIYIGDVEDAYISKMDLSAGQVTRMIGVGPGMFGSPTTGANAVVRVYPIRISFDHRNQIIYSLSLNNGTIQKIKL